MTRARWGLPALIAAMTFAAGLLAGHASRSEAAPAAPLPQAPLVAAAAQQLGVKRCLPAINSIAKRALTGATMQDILLDWDRQVPDNGPIFSFTGMGAGTQRAGLSLVAIPTAPNNCAVLVERMSATRRTCAAVAASELDGFTVQRLIDGIDVYQNSAQPGDVYALIASESGCLILRRQAMLRWPPRS